MSSWKKTFYSSCIAQFIAMLGFAFVLPFMAFYIQHLGVPAGPEADKWTGILVFASGIPMCVLAPVWGLLADRYGRKRMVLRAMLGGAAVIGLMGLARNVTDLLILRLLQGALTGTVSATMALVASITPEERAGYALGMVTVAASSGGFLGPLVGGFSAKFVGYRGTFFLAGGLLVLGGLIIKYGVEEKFERARATRTGVRASFLPLLTTGSFVIPMLTLCLINFAGSAPGSIFPYFVQHIHPMSDEDASALTGVLISVAGVVETLSAWIFGRFGDRWGHRKVLMFCVVWGGITASAQAYSQSIGQILLFRVLFGFGMAGIMPTASAIIRRVVPEDSLGKAFGVVTSFNAVGWSFGPLIGAYLAAFMGDYRPTFTLAGVSLCLVSLFIAWRVKDEISSAAPPPAPARLAAAPPTHAPAAPGQ